MIFLGCQLGFISGIIISFNDLLLMICSGNYVPPMYPLFTSFFNIFLWTFFGAFIGLCMHMYWKKQTYAPQMHHWFMAYLLPFFIIYAVFGLVPLPSSDITDTYIAPQSYLTWTSSLWLLLIYGFLFRYYKHNYKNKKVNPFSLGLETILIVTLSNFYFNFEIVGKSFIGNISAFKYILYGITLFVSVLLTGIMLKTKNLMLRRDHYFSSTKTYVVFIATVAFGLFFISTISTNFYKHYWTNPFQAPFSTTSRNSKKNDVILIVLDTVNAKSMSLYGGPAHTPNIEKLAQDSLTFTNCIASSSWTLPSHASLFSGYYPSEHLCILGNTKLNDKFDTLAEIFSSNGYQTAAIGANFGWLNERFNLNQGFQVYDVIGNIGSISRLPFHPLLQTFSYATNIYPKSILVYKVAEDMVNESIHQLETLSESSFFFFLNLLDAHSPYRPPYTFASTYTDKKLSSLYRFKQLMKYFSGSHTKSSWDSYLLSQYYGEITYLDSKLGELFDYLKSKNLYDSTLIVITADHGELFGKNGFYEHNNCPMYEGLVKIPLIVKTPFSKMVGIDNNTINLTDVFSTVLHLSNLPIPQGISGEPFGGKSSGVAEFLTLGHSIIGDHRVIYDGDYKAFKYRKPASWRKESSLRESELYHLTKDPDEQENLFKKNKAPFSQAATNLNLWTSKHQPKFEIGHMQKEPLADKLKETLKSLGYLQ